MGVSYEKARNKYRVTVREDGKTKHIGRYETRAEADYILGEYREEKKLTEELSTKLEALKNEPPSLASFYGFDIDDPIIEPEPTLWDRIKSIWRNTRQRN